MKILITGGAGYLGCVISQILLENGHEITVLDNLIYSQDSLLHLVHYKNFHFIRGDARDKNLIKKVMLKMDVIIPLAAVVGAPACDKDKEFARSINFGAIKTLNELRSKKQMVLFPNTNSGYGIGSETECCTEDSPLKPISFYGKIKVDAEKLLLDSENCIVFRLATVFGSSPRLRLDLLVNNFTYRALRDRVLVLFEANFRRNYIHIRDVANTFLYGIKMYDKMKDRPYNVGLSSANLTKLQLAEKIKEHIPYLNIIKSEIGEDPDKRDYIVSNERLEKIGWLPEYSLDDGIEEMIKCYSVINDNKYSNL